MYNTCSEWGMFLEEVKLHVNMYSCGEWGMFHSCAHVELYIG